MSTDGSRQRKARHRFPYTDKFRALTTDAQKKELSLLKKLYEKDQLTIRQIAGEVDASYGFIQQRLIDAGATTDIGRRGRPVVSDQVAATIAALPSRQAHS
ncbi:helix-turn-helix domain-containing protein [Actinoplanes sp. NPDC049316]|uniref:helix-turn-helix domain-containing protein n=1 Tax=Actinoplanes sp. NPDC049316 TaxID=3154727 RepID=UPI0034254832